MWKKLCVLALTAGAAFSGLGALVINLVIAMNHRRDRYIAT